MRLGDVPEKATIKLFDVEYEVVRQGTSGTSIRPTARIAKEVHGKRFASKAKPKLISSECDVLVVNLPS